MSSSGDKLIYAGHDSKNTSHMVSEEPRLSTIEHLFLECLFSQLFWKKLKTSFIKKLHQRCTKHCRGVGVLVFISGFENAQHAFTSNATEKYIFIVRK